MSYVQDDVTRKAKEFIASLDRSVLGRFAVPDDALYWYELYQRNEYEAGIYDSNEYLDHISGAGIKVEQEKGTSRSDMLSEWFFWWETKGTPRMQEWATTKTLMPDNFDRLDFLYLVSSSPISYHDYFAAGITDKEFIKQCITDGIDVELALAVER